MTDFIITWFSVIKLPISQSEVTTHPAASRWRGWSTRRWIARPYRRWAASRYPCRVLRAPGYTWGTWGQSYGSGSWAVPREQPGCPPALRRPPATQHHAAPSCPSRVESVGFRVARHVPRRAGKVATVRLDQALVERDLSLVEHTICTIWVGLELCSHIECSGLKTKTDWDTLRYTVLWWDIYAETYCSVLRLKYIESYCSVTKLIYIETYGSVVNMPPELHCTNLNSATVCRVRTRSVTDSLKRARPLRASTFLKTFSNFSEFKIELSVFLDFKDTKF